MSDFLSHIAARSIAAPSLRPRNRMRFEPSWPTAPRFEDEAPELSPSNDVPRTVTSAASSVDPSIEMPAAPFTLSFDIPIADEDRSVSIRSRASSPSAAPASAVDRGRAAEAVAARQPRSSPIASRADSGLIATGVQPSVFSETAVVTPATPRPVPHRSDVQPVPNAESRRPTAAPSRDDLLRIEAARMNRNAPARRRLVGARETLPGRPRSGTDDHSASTEEPIVQVSIGRVEVRATTPGGPSTAPAAPRRSTTMTIDDYIGRKDRR